MICRRCLDSVEMMMMESVPKNEIERDYKCLSTVHPPAPNYVPPEDTLVSGSTRESQIGGTTKECNRNITMMLTMINVVRGGGCRNSTTTSFFLLCHPTLSLYLSVCLVSYLSDLHRTRYMIDCKRNVTSRATLTCRLLRLPLESRQQLWRCCWLLGNCRWS